MERGTGTSGRRDGDRDKGLNSDPEWLDRSAYPFSDHFFESAEGTLHYVDEGSGHPIIFLHGNPEWSFSFRIPIKRLSGEYRCVAPDHLGFGLSEKPNGADLTPYAHARRLETLLDHLALERYTLVMNDWGGPIGMSMAESFPKRIAGLVVLNSWLWPLKKSLLFQFYSRTMGSALGPGFLARNRLLIRWGMPLGFARPLRFNKWLQQHYEGPFPDLASRRGQWTFGSSILSEESWLRDLWEARSSLCHAPMLLIKGRRDMAFTEKTLRKWQEGFPWCQAHRLSDAGHFPQEEQGELVAQHIFAFLSSSFNA